MAKRILTKQLDLIPSKALSRRICARSRETCKNWTRTCRET